MADGGDGEPEVTWILEALDDAENRALGWLSLELLVLFMVTLPFHVMRYNFLAFDAKLFLAMRLPQVPRRLDHALL